MACFGAGVSSACVVNVGEQVTSIACITDGHLVPGSQRTLCYGGGDLTTTLLWMLRRSDAQAQSGDPVGHRFTFSSVSLYNNVQDYLQLTTLKERICRFNLGRDIMLTHQQLVERRRARSTLLHSFYVSLAAVMTPLALFHPELIHPLRCLDAVPSIRAACEDIRSMDNVLQHIPKAYVDLFAEPYSVLTAGSMPVATSSADSGAAAGGDSAAGPASTAGHRAAAGSGEANTGGSSGGAGTDAGGDAGGQGREAMDDEDDPPAEGDADEGAEGESESGGEEEADAARSGAPVAGSAAAPSAPVAGPTHGSVSTLELDMLTMPYAARKEWHAPADWCATFDGKRTPLHRAVSEAILAVPALHMRQRLANSVLLIGGTAKIPGLVEEFEDRLIGYLPNVDLEITEVNVLPLKVDARFAPWKGAAVLSATDAVRDLYVTRREWELRGVRAIREKAYWDWMDTW